MSKPKIRLYLNLARSGGTLFSKCIGCMDGVMLLSETHPLGGATYNPISQASRWYNLFSDADKQALAAQGDEISYLDAIDAIYPLVEARGQTLLIRDWSHLDFTGVPFRDDLPGYSTHLEQLQSRYDVIAAATVRHPVPLWLSLVHHFKERCDVPLNDFLAGYRKFAELALETGFVRFETMLKNPEPTLKKLCSILEIPFDESYRERWASNRFVTGDSGVKGDNAMEDEIRQSAEEPIYPSSVILDFERSPDYRPALSLLGYKPAKSA
jgi:hypothetical protein